MKTIVGDVPPWNKDHHIALAQLLRQLLSKRAATRRQELMSEEPTVLRFADLVVGQRYRVEFDDCCIEGTATGILISNTSDDALAALVFDWGTLTRWWQCKFTLLEPE